MGISVNGVSGGSGLPTGSADVPGLAGAGTSEEWNSATPGLTWTTAPAVVDSNTTRPGHLYVKHNANNVVTLGLKNWAPAGAFDARLKVASLAADSAADDADVGLCVFDDTVPTNGAMIIMSLLRASNIFRIASYTYAATILTQRGSNWDLTAGKVYFRIVRDGSNNVSFFHSVDGWAWVMQATFNIVFTAAKIGIRFYSSVTSDKHLYCDWLRTSV